MGTSLSSDIFQRRVTNGVADVKPRPPKVYIDDVLTAAQHSFDEHLKMLDEIFVGLIRWPSFYCFRRQLIGYLTRFLL
eukprot:8647642-Ditylum_brightwellii.AAC.1